MRRPKNVLRQQEMRKMTQVTTPQAAYRRGQIDINWLRPADVVALQRSVTNRQMRHLACQSADMPAQSSRLAPPPKHSQPTSARSAALKQWLTAHMAGHALAVNTYTFYEVIDAYLGPWGNRGYPMAYGKRYNVLFATNRTLMAHPTARKWVWKTTILLQQALVDFIVARYNAGTLAKLTEAELRTAAFASHPKAYTEGGLALVAIIAPELIPEIARIPSAEFIPSSENFGASVEQVIVTGEMVVPRIIGNLIAAVMPVHSGSLRIAADRDRRRFLAELQLNRYLTRTKQAIADRKLNNIRALDAITRQLLRREFPDQAWAGVAREIVQIANRRKTELAKEYAAAIKKNPKLKPIYDKTQPGWQNWL